ncbi:MAG: phosphoadenylyl-sulfate reductase [Salinibacter sp.]
MAPPGTPSSPSWTRTRLSALNAQFEPRSPQVVLDWAATTFGDDLVQGTGFGPSGIVIMHMLSEIRPGTTVFYLDTDLLFPETYELRDELDETMDVSITRVHGQHSLDEQAEAEGPALWNRDPDRCCFLRKVQPLQNALAGREAWITGVRRDQSPARADAPILKWEPSYEVLKVNPLATWTRKQVWQYLFDHDLPYNPKHDQGYPSLGCVPCTAPVEDAEGYTRDGRWAGSDKTECGLHTPADDDE